VLGSLYCSIMLVAVGALALTVKSGYSYGFYGLCFAGFMVWLVRSRETLYRPELRYFLYPLVAYAVALCGMSLFEFAEWSPVGEYLPFVLPVSGVWLLRRYKVNAVLMWCGVAVGALLAGVLATYQGQYLGVRAGAHMLPIQFGNIALLFSMLCLIRLLAGGVLFVGAQLLLLSGLAGGIVASVFSQSRGGWVAILLILFWIFLQVSNKWRVLVRVGLFASFVTLLCAFALFSDGIVQQRIRLAADEIDAYIETGEQDTAVGSRLAMWRLGCQGVRDAPFVGQGDAGWIKNRNAAVASGELSVFSAGFGHLHNEFLNVAYKRGVVGLVFLLAMYLLPMLYFFRPYLNHDNPEVRALAMAGMVIPMMYMDFGLTQSFLTHNSGRIVLCSLWMCTAALMLNALEDHEVQA
jgi:O-antigen ligase